MNLLLQLLANGIVNGAMFALLAIGFGLVYRSLRVFHVAYGACFVLSAFVYYLLVTCGGWPWWLAGLGSIATSAAIGTLMEAGFYWPFYRRRISSEAVLVASLGLAIMLENVMALLFGNEVAAIPRGLSQSVTLGPVRLTMIQIAQFAICTSVASAVFLLLRLPSFKIVLGMGENTELVQTLGHSLPRYRMLVLGLASGIAAVPACLVMTDVGMDVHAGMSYLLIAAVAVLAGGVARAPGWLLGAYLVAVLQSVVIWKFSAKWTGLVAFALLLAILLFRREGLVGLHKRKEEG
ncbi:MAG: branched-chain amino acid ABC transporter permease [Pirellulaceae bacterium]|nr:branched-chain amino acid ABC transporter permease [Pirellulaceae bacterium]